MAGKANGNGCDNQLRSLKLVIHNMYMRLVDNIAKEVATISPPPPFQTRPDILEKPNLTSTFES